MDNFNIHNWQKKYLNEQAGNYNYLVKEDNYGGRGSDVAELYRSITQLSAEEMEELFEVLGSYFKDNVDTLTNMDADGIANKLDAVSDAISRRTGN